MTIQTTMQNLTVTIPVALNTAKADFEAANDANTRLQIWNEIDKIAKGLKVLEMEMRKVAATGMFPNPTPGTNTFDLGNGYKLKMVAGNNYKLASDGTLDAALAVIEGTGAEGQFIAERLVKFDPRLSKTEYDALDPKNPVHAKIKAAIDGVLTISPASPELKIEEPKSK